LKLDGGRDGAIDLDEDDEPAVYTEVHPSEQMARLKASAYWKLGSGVALLVVFAGPMVDILAEIGRRLEVSPFYVAFLLAPLASGAAAEISAASALASRRTRRSATAALAVLQRAAVVNNTLCLGILVALMYVRGLEWVYTAETIVIVLVELRVASSVVGCKTQTLKEGWKIFSLYPIACVAICLLRHVHGLS